MFSNRTRSTLTEAAVMGQKLVNHVPELLNRLGMDSKTFQAKCMLDGMSESTSRRILNGETQITSKNLGIAAGVLGVSIGEIIEIVEQ
jgi:hypothetical protein